MHEFSVKYLKCVVCTAFLDLEIFEKTDEIHEGYLQCVKCKRKYPIVSSVAFLLQDFALYFSIRAELGGLLMLKSKSKKLQSFIRESLRKIEKVGEDTTKLERNWGSLYQKSSKSKFYNSIKKSIRKIPRCDLALEHGCSVGNISKAMAARNEKLFGIDKSFFAVLEAKRLGIKNADFFVSDSLAHPFGDRKFDLVVSLNLLELIEPPDLLKMLFLQAGKFLILSDPYDFERGKNSVKNKIDAKTLRSNLAQKGFKLIQNTKRPSFVPWKLRINPRLELNYKVDLIVAKKLL